jgi:hypothetical protein
MVKSPYLRKGSRFSFWNIPDKLPKKPTWSAPPGSPLNRRFPAENLSEESFPDKILWLVDLPGPCSRLFLPKKEMTGPVHRSTDSCQVLPLPKKRSARYSSGNPICSPKVELPPRRKAPLVRQTNWFAKVIAVPLIATFFALPHPDNQVTISEEAMTAHQALGATSSRPPLLPASRLRGFSAFGNRERWDSSSLPILRRGSVRSTSPAVRLVSIAFTPHLRGSVLLRQRHPGIPKAAEQRN